MLHSPNCRVRLRRSTGPSTILLIRGQSFLCRLSTTRIKWFNFWNSVRPLQSLDIAGLSESEDGDERCDRYTAHDRCMPRILSAVSTAGICSTWIGQGQPKWVKIPSSRIRPSQCSGTDKFLGVQMQLRKRIGSISLHSTQLFEMEANASSISPVPCVQNGTKKKKHDKHQSSRGVLCVTSGGSAWKQLVTFLLASMRRGHFSVSIVYFLGKGVFR